MKINFEICTPYADEQKCKMRPVLDGEYWCETHKTYQWFRADWRRFFEWKGESHA